MLEPHPPLDLPPRRLSSRRTPIIGSYPSSFDGRDSNYFHPEVVTVKLNGGLYLSNKRVKMIKDRIEAQIINDPDAGYERLKGNDFKTQNTEEIAIEDLQANPDDTEKDNSEPDKTKPPYVYCSEYFEIRFGELLQDEEFDRDVLWRDYCADTDATEAYFSPQVILPTLLEIERSQRYDVEMEERQSNIELLAFDEALREGIMKYTYSTGGPIRMLTQQNEISNIIFLEGWESTRNEILGSEQLKFDYMFKFLRKWSKGIQQGIMWPERQQRNIIANMYITGLGVIHEAFTISQKYIYFRDASQYFQMKTIVPKQIHYDVCEYQTGRTAKRAIFSSELGKQRWLDTIKGHCDINTSSHDSTSYPTVGDMSELPNYYIRYSVIPWGGCVGEYPCATSEDGGSDLNDVRKSNNITACRIFTAATCVIQKWWRKHSAERHPPRVKYNESFLLSDTEGYGLNILKEVMKDIEETGSRVLPSLIVINKTLEQH
eukprot:Tbor_TRINITY_DN3905_c0_g1::TRINITY_DN3905_c0_g1_i1::g.804::m.804